jgi:hypothetical protein
MNETFQSDVQGTRISIFNLRHPKQPDNCCFHPRRQFHLRLANLRTVQLKHFGFSLLPFSSSDFEVS